MALLTFLFLLLSLRLHETSSLLESRDVLYSSSSHLVNPTQQQSHQQQHQQQQRRQQQLLLCGDIQSHPGPTPSSDSGKKTRRVSYPCTVCEKGVTRASKAVSCDVCNQWTHVKCSSSVTLTKYESCVRSGGEIAFICDGCAFSSLPFIDDAGVSTAIGNSSPPIPNPSSPLLSCPIPTILNQKGLHFLHANVRSLIPKIPEIRLLLSRTKTAVFAATETWLDSSINDGEIHIPGYNVVRRDRNRNGGGVALFIRDDISFNPRPDLTVDGIEGLWIELLLPRSQGILLCCTYRPPNDSSFIHKFESAC